MKKNEMRLNRYLAMCGVGSRRKCDELIAAGLVQVNDKVVTEMGERLKPDEDVVKFKGKVVEPEENRVYILLNKPLRTITSADDEKKRRTVLDVVKMRVRIFPVGRLDYNTTGALLLTNDGELAYKLSHPKYEISKLYRVLLDSRIRPIDLHHFRRGIELEGEMTAPCRAEELRILDNCSYLEIELHEGRNRQIRKMFESLGYKVRELHRIEYAGLRVSDLKTGAWRNLHPQEVRRLKKLVGSRKEELQGDERG